MRVLGLAGLAVLGLLVLDLVPRARARAEAVYYVSQLRPGAILHATWRGRGGIFRDAVVLLGSHDERGSIGFVIEGGRNAVEPSEGSQSRALENGDLKWDGRLGAIDAGIPAKSVRWGGPVDTHLGWVLSSDPRYGELSDWERIDEGIWLLSLESFAEAEAILSAMPEAEFLVGYAGWAPGQLAKEVRAVGWRVVARP